MQIRMETWQNKLENEVLLERLKKAQISLFQDERNIKKS